MMLAESSTSNLPSMMRPVSPKPAPIRSQPTKRSRARGTSSVSNITGNTASQAVQQAAMRKELKAGGHGTSLRAELEGFPVKSRAAVRSAQSSSEPTVSYRLPITLPRPKDMPMVTNEMLTSLDADLDGVAVPFIKDALQNRRDAMLRGIGSVVPGTKELPPSPTELNVHISDRYANDFVVYPTHLLCITKAGAATGGVIYPVNALVMVSHCARLPQFPPPGPLQPDISNDLLLPVVSLSLPHPDSFPLIFDYLYTKHFGRLCAALCPIPVDALPGLTNIGGTGGAAMFKGIVDTIRETYGIAALLEKMQFIHGIWSNVCHLGIAEESIWKCLNLAWQVLMRALAAKPAVQVSAPPPSSVPPPSLL